jgi:DNA-binding Lrp family transcriptional regulator
VSDSPSGRAGDHRLTVEAYIYIQTDRGQAAEVAAHVRSLPSVVAADAVVGPYDIIALAEADTINALGRMVLSQIQMIDGVTRTLTSQIVHL